MSESFFAVGDFAGVTTRGNIEVATIEDIADYEISSNDGDIGGDVGDDGPDAGLERFLVSDSDIAGPGNKSSETVTTTFVFENRGRSHSSHHIAG